MTLRLTQEDQARRLPCYNTTDEEIPAFAVMRVIEVDDDGILQVGKPNVNGGDTYAFNGSTPIPVPINTEGGFGQCSCDHPLFALYETADGTPANGELWGAGSGTWKLRKNNSGYIVWGGVNNEVAEIVPSDEEPCRWARLTAHSGVTGAYAWVEVEPTAGGGWSTVAGGLSGSLVDNAAFEANSTCVAVGSIARICPTAIPSGDGVEWRFVQCCPACSGSGSGSCSADFSGCTGMPCTIYLSFSYGGVDYSFTLTWNSITGQFETDDNQEVCGDVTNNFALQCAFGCVDFSSMNLTGSGGGGWFSGAPDAGATCDLITFTGVSLPAIGSCSAETVDMVISL